MEVITPKRVVGVHHDPNKFFTIRICYKEGMQEFLCPDGEDVYHSQQERRREGETLHLLSCHPLLPAYNTSFIYPPTSCAEMQWLSFDEYLDSLQSIFSNNLQYLQI